MPKAVGEIRRLFLLFQHVGRVSLEGPIGQESGNEATHFGMWRVQERMQRDGSRGIAMDRSKNRLEARDRFVCKSIALEAYTVDRPDAGAVPLHNHVGGNVQLAKRPSRHERIVANGEPLPDGCQATKGNVISNSYVTSKLNSIRHGDSATEDAVVRDVAAGHEQCVVANNRVSTFRASMNGYMLSYFHAISNIEATVRRGLFRRTSRLSATADDGKRMDNTVFAHRGLTNDRMPLDAAAGADPCPRLHNRIRADDHAAPQDGLGGDQRPGVDPAHQAAPPRGEVR